MEEAKDPAKEARMSAFWDALREVAKAHGMELSCVLTYTERGVLPNFRIVEVPKEEEPVQTNNA
jgi:hypothetical protein